MKYITKNYKPDKFSDKYVYCIYDEKGLLARERLMLPATAHMYAAANKLEAANFMRIFHLQQHARGQA